MPDVFTVKNIFGHKGKKEERVKEMEMAIGAVKNKKESKLSDMVTGKKDARDEKRVERSSYTDSDQESKIRTALDQLLDMIVEKGSVSVPDAAKRLHVTEKQVEEWAHILEDHGLIEMHYPAVGKPVLKRIDHDAEEDS